MRQPESRIGGSATVNPAPACRCGQGGGGTLARRPEQGGPRGRGPRGFVGNLHGCRSGTRLRVRSSGLPSLPRVPSARPTDVRGGSVPRRWCSSRRTCVPAGRTGTPPRGGPTRTASSRVPRRQHCTERILLGVYLDLPRSPCPDGHGRTVEPRPRRRPGVPLRPLAADFPFPGSIRPSCRRGESGLPME